MPPYYIGVSGLIIMAFFVVVVVNVQSRACTVLTAVLFSQSLRKALRIMGAPNLLADNLEYGLSYSVVSYLKKLSQQVSC